MQFIQLTSKTDRFYGMVVFAIAATFLLWYVDWDRFQITGVDINPFGFGSVMGELADEMFSENYRYREANAAWLISQVVPWMVAWPVRHFLGAVVAGARHLLTNLFQAV